MSQLTHHTNAFRFGSYEVVWGSVSAIMWTLLLPKAAVGALQSIKTCNELHHNAAFDSDVTRYDVLWPFTLLPRPELRETHLVKAGSGVTFPHWFTLSRVLAVLRKKRERHPFVRRPDSSSVKKHKRVKSSPESGDNLFSGAPFFKAQTKIKLLSQQSFPSPTGRSSCHSWKTK